MSFFLFTTTAPTETYTLSLHDALPISLVHPGVQPLVRPHDHGKPLVAQLVRCHAEQGAIPGTVPAEHDHRVLQDRKSTRLNSSHTVISYAVFCLKKKKQKKKKHKPQEQ